MRDNIILLTLSLSILLIGAANVHTRAKYDESHYTSRDRQAIALADVYGLSNADVAKPVELWK